MARDPSVLNIQCGTFFVGTSASIGLSAVQFQEGAIIKALAVGTSGLFIGGVSMAVGLSAIDLGYQMSTGEIIPFPLSGNVYFSSAGSTATVTYMFQKTNAQGVTTPGFA
jgi:hypothetical protein